VKFLSSGKWYMYTDCFEEASTKKEQELIIKCLPCPSRHYWSM